MIHCNGIGYLADNGMYHCKVAATEDDWCYRDRKMAVMVCFNGIGYHLVDDGVIHCKVEGTGDD